MFIDCLKDYPKNIANFFSENNPTMNLIASTLRKKDYREVKNPVQRPKRADGTYMC